MTYEFRCQQCHREYTEDLDPSSDKRVPCPGCGTVNYKSFGEVQLGYFDWGNPGWHGDGINLALGKHFKSGRHREEWAKANGYEKLDR